MSYPVIVYVARPGQRRVSVYVDYDNGTVKEALVEAAKAGINVGPDEEVRLDGQLVTNLSTKVIAGQEVSVEKKAHIITVLPKASGGDEAYIL